MTLAYFLSHYGYLALLVGTFLEGETILVLGGLAAHQGYLTLTGVILSAFAGSLMGDQLFFYLGRRRGASMLKKSPGWQKKIARVNQLAARYESAVIVLFRFVYGFRTITPFVMGMGHVRVVKFFILNSTGAILWAAMVGTGGYLFGTAVEAVIGDLRSVEKWLLLLVAAVGGLVWLIRVLRARRSRKHSGNE